MIVNRFELEEEIGAGAMGRVWRARDAMTGGRVALKLVQQNAPRDRFEQEAALLASLDHPGIVRYVAHGIADGVPYLAMEWLEGESLEAVLERGPLGVSATIVLGARVADALAAAHAIGVVHRDLKPANLLLEGGAFDRPKLIDFGIAHADHRPLIKTQTGVAIGTPGYMAPEQARGERGLDGRADVFSLGCVLFESASGQPAFAGENVMAILAKILLEEPPLLGELLPSAPETLEALVARMLAKERDARPVDARAIARELEAMIGAPPGGRVTRRATLTSREQRLAAIVLRGAATFEDAKTLGPEAADDEASLVLNPSVQRAVLRHGAKLERLAGGGLALLLPGEGSATDLAARAAACALALRDGSAIALAMGRAEVGGKLPVGEAIDRAAKLARRTKGPLWIDETTRTLLAETFASAELEGAAVLIGRRETDALRTLCGKPTACVGREAWIAALDAIYTESIEQPEARAAVVVAPSGAGKSRLRYETLQRLRARRERVEVWLARGDVIGAGSAFGLAAQWIRHATGVRAGEPLGERQEKLFARVARYVPADRRRRVATFLGEMVGTRFSADGDVQLQAARSDSILMGDQIRRAWEDLIDAETADHPLTLVLEDLHWGDKPTIELVDSAMRLFPKRSLFVLALGRPEIDSLFPELWSEHATERIHLPPLSRSASEKLARKVLGDANPDVARIVDQAGGNAFYLEELIRAVVDGRGDRLPDTVLASIEARITALEPNARKALRAASVFGQAFWAGGVRVLAGDPAAAALAELEACEMVSRRGTSKLAGEVEYVFRHAMLREAAYAMLVDADRILGHKLAGDWLHERGEADALSIAEHFEKGGESARAVAVFLRAAEQALEANDLEQAIARAERGIACHAEGEALGHLHRVEAEAMRWRGDYAGTLVHGEVAVQAVPRESETWGDAVGEVGVAAGELGHVERLVAASTALLAAAGSSHPSAGALRGAARVSGTCFFAGRTELAESLLHAAEAHLEDAPTSVRARIFGARALRSLLAGDPVAALEHCRRALDAFVEIGDLRNACNARVSLGYSHLEVGAFAEAERLLSSAAADAQRLRLGNVNASATQNLGWVLTRLGRFEQARSLLRQSAELFRAQGNRRMEGASRIYLASSLASSGDLAQAEKEARAAAEICRPSPPVHLHALAVLARVLVAKGRLAEALEAARAAMSELDALGGVVDEGEAEVRLAVAEALDASGDRAAARAAIDTALARLRQRADHIKDERWRKSFLENVPEHAQTIELARAWGRDHP